MTNYDSYKLATPPHMESNEPSMDAKIADCVSEIKLFEQLTDDVDFIDKYTDEMLTKYELEIDDIWSQL